MIKITHDNKKLLKKYTFFLISLPHPLKKKNLMRALIDKGKHLTDEGILWREFEFKGHKGATTSIMEF